MNIVHVISVAVFALMQVVLAFIISFIFMPALLDGVKSAKYIEEIIKYFVYLLELFVLYSAYDVTPYTAWMPVWMIVWDVIIIITRNFMVKAAWRDIENIEKKYDEEIVHKK